MAYDLPSVKGTHHGRAVERSRLEKAKGTQSEGQDVTEQDLLLWTTLWDSPPKGRV